MSLQLTIIGHKQHGKGTLAAIAEKHFGLSAQGTSRHTAQIMFNLLKDQYGYRSVDECYQDRGNHRDEWFDALNAYCGDNPSRIIEEIFAEHDICEGPRNRIEFEAAKQKKALGDLIIFVDASARKPLEPASSMQLTRDDAHIIIENNGTEAEFEAKCVALLSLLVRSDLYSLL